MKLINFKNPGQKKLLRLCLSWAQKNFDHSLIGEWLDSLLLKIDGPFFDINDDDIKAHLDYWNRKRKHEIEV